MEYGANEQYSLRWKHFNENISSGLYQSQRQGDFVDMTLAVEGHTMQVHRLVMSVCSPYFQKMLTIMPANYHPFVLLKDVSYGVLEKLIEFIYNGEVTVDKEILAEFMSTGEALQIKGLVDNDDWQRHVDTSTKNVQKQQSSTVQQQQQQNANIMRNSASQLTRSPMTSNQTFIPTRAAPTSRNVDQLQHCRTLQQRNADLMAKHASYLAQSPIKATSTLTNVVDSQSLHTTQQRNIGRTSYSSYSSDDKHSIDLKQQTRKRTVQPQKYNMTDIDVPPSPKRQISSDDVSKALSTLTEFMKKPDFSTNENSNQYWANDEEENDFIDDVNDGDESSDWYTDQSADEISASKLHLDEKGIITYGKTKFNKPCLYLDGYTYNLRTKNPHEAMAQGKKLIWYCSKSREKCHAKVHTSRLEETDRCTMINNHSCGYIH